MWKYFSLQWWLKIELLFLLFWIFFSSFQEGWQVISKSQTFRILFWSVKSVLVKVCNVCGESPHIYNIYHIAPKPPIHMLLILTNLPKKMYYVLWARIFGVSFPSHLKKLCSILRFWLEKLNCGFFHSFHSRKNTTKQLFQSKFQCRK